MGYISKKNINIMIVVAFAGMMLLSVRGNKGELLGQEMRQGVLKKAMQKAGKINVEQGAKMKGQWKEEMVVPKAGINLPEMEWVLFLETEVSYGASGNPYYRYAIYGDSTETRKEGEEKFFSLHQRVPGIIPELSSCTEGEDKGEEYENQMMWIECTDELIVECSSDLEWIITWQKNEPLEQNGIERWYKNGVKVEEFEKVYRKKSFIPQQGEEEFLSMEDWSIARETIEKLNDEGVWSYSSYDDTIYCFSTTNKMFASANKNTWDDADAIHIYMLKEEDVLLYDLPVPTDEARWPIQVSQLVGDEHSGWLIFNYGYETFRMTYPDGEIKKLGEYMFSTTYSPDEKYLSYCTGNETMWDSWIKWAGVDESMIGKYVLPMKEEWKKIPQGWYVINLETGEKSYIPVPVWIYDADRPLYDGYCTWIEKDKLIELLEK